MTSFTYTKCAGGYEVRAHDGTHLGDVKHSGAGWSSRLPEDAAPGPADRATRLAAAERLVGMRASREFWRERNEPAEVPEGFEVVDAAELVRGDTVLIPGRYTEAGKVGAWSRDPRTVCRAKATRSVVSVSFSSTRTTRGRTGGATSGRPGAGRWPAASTRRTPGPPRTATATGHDLSRALTNFDFMTLMDWVYRVRNEGSGGKSGAPYAHANWTWTFDDPRLTARGATLEGMLTLQSEHTWDIAAFERRTGAVRGWLGWHTDELLHRREHAALYAARRQFDDEFILLDSAEQAERWRTATPADAYSVCTAYYRSEPGGEWIEATNPLIPVATPTHA